MILTEFMRKCYYNDSTTGRFHNQKSGRIGAKIRLMFETVQHISSGKFISRGEWIHPDRTIDSYELIFVLTGTVFINENGVEYVLEKNDALLLQPGLRHFGYRPSRNTSFYWVHWTGGPDLSVRFKCQHMIKPYHLSLLFGQLLNDALDGMFRESTDYFTRLILMELYRSETDNKNQAVNRAVAWIKANDDLSLKVSDVAAQFGYNADYLSRIFRAHVGKSVKAYIDETRIEHIKNRLLGDATLNEIAAACGFSEYKYFLKFFTYHVGMTPTAFRAAYSKSHINHR